MVENIYSNVSNLHAINRRQLSVEIYRGSVDYIQYTFASLLMKSMAKDCDYQLQ